jgi:hypothetical protein
MVSTIIPILLIVVAALCNAVMDIVENENFSSSRFANREPRFWYKRESWKWATRIGGYKIDAWHISKSLMLVLLLIKPGYIINWWADLLILGVVWNVSFNIFYKFLKKR